MSQYRRLFGAHRKAVENDPDEMRVCEVRLNMPPVIPKSAAPQDEGVCRVFCMSAYFCSCTTTHASIWAPRIAVSPSFGKAQLKMMVHKEVIDRKTSMRCPANACVKLFF